MSPVLPVAPVYPGLPVSPVGPFAPVTPVLPIGPVTPVAPRWPVAPVDPSGPVKPDIHTYHSFTSLLIRLSQRVLHIRKHYSNLEYRAFGATHYELWFTAR